jgi:hypothetical protein
MGDVSIGFLLPVRNAHTLSGPEEDLIMSETVASNSDLAEIKPLFEDFLEENPQFTENQLRYLVRTRDDNGMAEAGAIVRIGSRWYVVASRFKQWLLDRAVAA